MKPQITGYRTLSEAEVAAMNEGKAVAEYVGKWIAALEADPSTDKRWVSIGKTHLQQGFMAALRGIAQPTTF
jgi:hypothetical protein